MLLLHRIWITKLQKSVLKTFLHASFFVLIYPGVLQNMAMDFQTCTSFPLPLISNHEFGKSVKQIHEF